MGAILGVAIGSVVSISLAPKKKPEEEILQSTKQKKGLFSFFKKKQKNNKTEISEYPKKIPTETE